MIELAPAHDGAHGALGYPSAVSEQAHAEGIYHAIFEGYKEHHKKEYLELHPKLRAMRNKRDWLLRWTPNIAPAVLKGFFEELDALEIYMKGMTEVKREAWALNTVMTVGKNLALDTFLAGSAYTVTGPYMGLIGAVSFSGAPVAADTMASHATWTEAGTTNAPTYTGPRKTVSWSAASAGSKAPSSAPVFSFTGSGTAKGVFLVFGSGALSTIDNTGGILWSAGLFTAGDQLVANTNTVTVTYTTSL